MITRLGFIVVVASIAAAGCLSPVNSSLLPTAPTAAQRMPASSMQAPGGDVCGAYEEQARGACHALFAQHCEADGPTAPTCDRLVEDFVNATGTLPPFIARYDVSRDIEACVVIRWGCQDPFTPFTDPTGCGCLRNT